MRESGITPTIPDRKLSMILLLEDFSLLLGYIGIFPLSLHSLWNIFIWSSSKLLGYINWVYWIKVKELKCFLN